MRDYQEISLHGEFADLGMQGSALLVKGFRLALGTTGVKHAVGLVGELLFPFGDLHGMHVELFSDLLDGLDAFEGFQGHAGLELGVMSFAFGFHFFRMDLGLKSSLQPPSTHNIAPGPNFGVHLRPPACRSAGPGPASPYVLMLSGSTKFSIPLFFLLQECSVLLASF
jgi:hypothetical protein